VPEKYRFNLKAWDFLIVVGSPPKDLPEFARSLDPEERLMAAIATPR